MGTMSFGDLRKKAIGLGIDVKGKRPAEIEKEIEKKEAAAKPAKAAPKAKAEAAPVKKETAVKSEVVFDSAATEKRLLEAEATIVVLTKTVESLLDGLKAVAEEIGFELPEIGGKEAKPSKEAAPAKEEGRKRGRPRKQVEPEPEDEEEEEEVDEDEVAAVFSKKEIEDAGQDRLVEIAQIINSADGDEEKIEVVKNTKKLRAAILAWLNAHGEKVVEDEPEAVEKEEADEDAEEEEESEDDDESEDEDEEEGSECPEYCKKGAAIEVCFNADDGDEEWLKGVVLKVEEESADVKLEDGRVAEVPFDSMRMPEPKKVKLSAKGSKKK